MYQVSINLDHVHILKNRAMTFKYIYTIKLKISPTSLLTFEMNAFQISEMLANLYL